MSNFSLATDEPHSWILPSLALSTVGKIPNVIVNHLIVLRLGINNSQILATEFCTG